MHFSALSYCICIVTCTVKLQVKFENGEERMMEMKKVEPEGDEFEEPQPGSEVCCIVGGGRYSAVIVECVCGEVCM